MATLKELKEYCNQRNIKPIGDARRTKSYEKAIARYEAQLQTHNIEPVPVEMVDHECEGMTKQFPAYVVKNDIVASTCATCPAWRWQGFKDGHGNCQAREIFTKGDHAYHQSVCDGAMERWRETQPVENLDQVKEDLEHIYNDINLVGYFDEPAEEMIKSEPEYLPEWEDYGNRVMARRSPRVPKWGKGDFVDDYIFAVYIGCDSEEEGKLICEALIKAKDGFRRDRMGREDFSKSLLVRPSKWSMNTDWEVRILHPRFKFDNEKIIFIRGNQFNPYRFDDPVKLFEFDLDQANRWHPNETVVWERTHKGLVPIKYSSYGIIDEEDDFRDKLYRDSYQFTLVGKNNSFTYKTRTDDDGYCWFYLLTEGLMIEIAASKDKEIFYHGYESMNDHFKKALSALRWWFIEKKAATNAAFCRDLIKGV